MPRTLAGSLASENGAGDDGAAAVAACSRFLVIALESGSLLVRLNGILGFRQEEEQWKRVVQLQQCMLVFNRQVALKAFARILNSQDSEL